MKHLSFRIKSCSVVLLLILSQSAFTPSSRESIRASQSSPITFAVISDYGFVGQPAADVAALVKSWNPDFIVTSGDNNQKGGKLEMDDNIGQYYHEYLYNYAGKYGEGSPTRRFYPTLGNHDWSGEGVDAYLQYFRMRDFQRYYEFVQGPVHFFMIDSDGNEPDGVTSDSQQARWLKKMLAASTSPFDVVIFHHPPYTSGWHKPSEYMRWPFQEWGADIVLTGHNHLYERLSVNGFPYITNGLGGADIYQFETIVPESQVRFNADYGAMRVEATNTTIKFQMFTRTGMLVDEYIIDKSIPTITSITSIDPNPSNAATLNFSLTFSEPVTGVDVSDFALTSTIIDAQITGINGSENSYVISVSTGIGDGSIQLGLVDDDSIINRAGNRLGGVGIGNGNYLSSVYTIDKTLPTIQAITRINPNPTNAASVDYAVSFSEPVTGVDGSDFSLFSSNSSDASITNVSGSGNLYIVSINTGSEDTTLRLDFIKNNSVLDIAGNSPIESFTNSETYEIDKNSPRVTSVIRSGPYLTNSQTVDFIVTFSELVFGLDESSFGITTEGIKGAFISNIVDANPFYVITVNTGGGDGSLRLDVIDNDLITDEFGLPLGNFGIGNGNFTNSETYSIDKTAPYVTSIIRANTNPSASLSVDFIVTFSEPVHGVDNGDFTSSTDINGVVISNLVDVNPFYVISASTGMMDGSLRLDLINNNSIVDSAGNLLASGFENGEIYSITKNIINFPAPNIIGPRQNAVTNSPSPAFSWKAVKNARSYEVFIAADSNLTKIISNQTTPSTSLVLNSALPDGLYYFVLRAYNQDLLPGKFSTIQSFTIDSTPPSPPTLASPPDQSISPKRPWLQWFGTDDSVQYQIEMDNDINFRSPEISETPKTPYIRAKAVPTGTYFWRVRAKDAAGNWSNWSATFTLRLQ